MFRFGGRQSEGRCGLKVQIEALPKKTALPFSFLYLRIMRFSAKNNKNQTRIRG